MSANFPYNQTLSLLLEHLKSNYEGQFDSVVNGVITLAIDKGIFPGPSARERMQWIAEDYRKYLNSSDKKDVPELIRQLMWKLLIQDVIVFGKDEKASDFPWYRITGYGEKVIQSQKLQPYDPDGFLNEFKSENKNVDNIIYEYLEEAVRTFNHNCPKSSSVMLGASSERAILILYGAFLNSITAVIKKSKVEKDSNWTISSKFKVLEDRFQLMIDSKKFPKNVMEIILGNFPSMFHLIRKHRNSSGHPEILADISNDTIFLNLRVFSAYIKDIYVLIDYFKNNPSDW